MSKRANPATTGLSPEPEPDLDALMHEVTRANATLIKPWLAGRLAQPRSKKTLYELAVSSGQVLTACRVAIREWQAEIANA